MKRAAFALAALLCCVAASAGDPPRRPRILGIARVHLYSTDLEKTRSFYGQLLNMTPGDVCFWCERHVSGRLQQQSPQVVLVSSNQQLILSRAPKLVPSSLLYEFAFATDDLKAMETYLVANNVAIKKIRDLSNHRLTLTATDPEGHHVAFIQLPSRATTATLGDGTLHIIHAGIVVHDREAEDRFYKDILGFHVYWHGGMKEDQTDWVDMQVPDGTDWLEYMLNVSPNADKHTRGVMNHIALGVPDIHAAEQQLLKNGWKPGEKSQIGRDGKWQLNLYDPDDTRVELMEFTPVQIPCCAEYTGPHPGPQPSSKVPAKP